MDTDLLQKRIEMMKAVVDPWYQSLADPAKAQEIVLERLLKGYGQTEYGRNQGCENVGSYADFIRAFPVKTYEDFKPLVDKVLAGDTNVLLHEELVAVGLTRGSTTGVSKLIPITPTDLKLAWTSARTMMNYALTKQNFEVLSGFSLNLNNASNLGTIKVGNKDLVYGFSSAILMRLMKTNQETDRSVPTAQEIDNLGGGATRKDWHARYELVYEKAREKNVTSAFASALNAVSFGRYTYHKYKIYPKEFMKLRLMSLFSHPGVHSRFWTPLHDLYGRDIEVRDVYGASEGNYGSQIDDKKAWSPYYDNLFFEVQTINGIKQLHEMYPGEIGSLVVSTPVFPRYRNRDLILSFEPPYFRCIGRENTKLHPYNFGILEGKSNPVFYKSIKLTSWR
jgi:hypothetical protein